MTLPPGTIVTVVHGRPDALEPGDQVLVVPPREGPLSYGTVIEELPNAGARVKVGELALDSPGMTLEKLRAEGAPVVLAMGKG